MCSKFEFVCMWRNRCIYLVWSTHLLAVKSISGAHLNVLDVLSAWHWHCVSLLHLRFCLQIYISQQTFHSLEHWLCLAQHYFIQCVHVRIWCLRIPFQRLILHSSNAIRFVFKMQMERINENFPTTFVICECCSPPAYRFAHIVATGNRINFPILYYTNA